MSRDNVSGLALAVMQPTYLHWLGYFDLIDQVDVFILLDNVQFSKQSWQQRNRIKSPRGLEWLTVPVKLSGRFGQLIRDVEIHDTKFAKQHRQSILTNYAASPHFREWFPSFEETLMRAASTCRLLELNHCLLTQFCNELGIQTKLIVASELGIEGKRSALLAEICVALGARTYVSPLGSSVYLLDEIEEFAQRDIEVVFHHYEHPKYSQLFPPFVSHASIVDLVLNEGDRSTEIIRSGRRPNYSVAELWEIVKSQAIAGTALTTGTAGCGLDGAGEGPI